MIRTSPATIRRAAAVALAAAVLPFLTPHAAAQQNVDLFGGTYPGTNTVTAATSGVLAGASQTNTFGPDYTGNVSLLAGAVTTVSETFNPVGTSNALSITQTGLLAAGSTTSATKTFGLSLTPGATYSFTLTRTAGFTVGLVSVLNLQITAGNTILADTVTGQGFGGVVNALNLFNTNNTATFDFTVPTNATGALGVNINTVLGAGALNGNFTLSGASINQVPEPGTVAAMFLGAGGLVALRFRRRLAVA